ncbi:MAG: transglycosylase SLT domain-containing protein [Chloroflexota bacterium]|nr:transglycosylase SLT domain-containing protein [Chloroflexota bacterium]
MKTTTELAARLRRGRAKLEARVQSLSARKIFTWLAANLLRILRLSRAQIRGGRKLLKRDGVWYVPLWLPIALLIVLISTPVWDDAAQVAGRLSAAALHLLQGGSDVELAAFFAPAVRHWSEEIKRWSAQHEVDPHLLATVMQIESCGHPEVISNAGARGLFQVMPFHFDAGEDMLDPNINAARGASYLKYCAGAADEVIGRALACYNGGPSVLKRARESWSHETQKYYRWGVGIYSDAIAGASRSETFERWLAAGGERLCASALEAVKSETNGTP